MPRAEPGDGELQSLVAATLRLGSATGFLLDRQGSRFLVTAAHVLGTDGSMAISQAVESVEVTEPTRKVKAAVLKTDEGSDLALVDAADISTSICALPMGKDMPLGTEVWSAGYPDGWQGATPVVSRGHIAGVDGSTVWAAFDAGAGSSGGPVVALTEGLFYVIGVVKGRAGKPDPELQRTIQESEDDFLNLKPSEDGEERKQQAVLAASYGAIHIVSRFVDKHFRTGFVELIQIKRIVPLMPSC